MQVLHWHARVRGWDPGEGLAGVCGIHPRLAVFLGRLASEGFLADAGHCLHVAGQAEGFLYFPLLVASPIGGDLLVGYGRKH